MFVKVSAMDVGASLCRLYTGARVDNSGSGINLLSFCKESQSKFSSSANHNSLSLSLAHCLSMSFDYISLNTRWSSNHYIWRSQRDYRNISSEIRFSEKRIESPSDTYGYRVLLIFYRVHWWVFGAIEKLEWDQILHSNFSTRAR